MGMAIQKEKEVAAAAAVPPVGANKRRRRPSHEPSGDEHHQNPKKKARRLPVPWASLTRGITNLPSFFTEYTTEDAARFDEDMARTDKLLDEALAKVRAPGFHPDDLHLPHIEPFPPRQLVQPGPGGRVPDATIQRIRSFASSSGYNPISERLLRDPYLFTQAQADECRKRQRLISKAYAQAQARATEVVHHYHAKGYLEYNLDGTINVPL